MMSTLRLHPKMEPSFCSELEPSFVERAGATQAQTSVKRASLIGID
jgi:hypothetical protein